MTFNELLSNIIQKNEIVAKDIINISEYINKKDNKLCCSQAQI